jgi:apolipoprotein N-acyltransferase
MKISKLLIPLIMGLIGIFSFAPFSIKFLIFISYAYLIHKILYEKSYRFITVFLWGIGHWGFGMSWIIVSIYYYGETSIALSLLIYFLLLIILSFVFTCPLLLIRYLLNKLEITENYLIILATSTLLMIGEFSRYHFLNGVPWLIPGNLYLDTITQNIYPIFGVSAASLIMYMLCCLLVVFYYKNKNFLSIIILIIISIIPNHRSIADFDDGTSISIIQPSSDPFKKYTQEYQTQIEGKLFNLLNKTSDLSEIIVLPEVELPYTIKSRRFDQFVKKAPKSNNIVMGAWDTDKEGNLYNTVYSLKNYNFSLKENLDSYKKMHLVPFGEYIPFIPSLRGLVGFFDLPMSNIMHGPENQKNIIILDNISIATPICFDIAFANTVRKMNKSSFLIINVSNDTWFGNSIGPYQHLSIARIRSIENNRWSIRATNDGISAIISNKGTIVDKLEKGAIGILEGKVQLINKNTFYNSYGYLFSYIFSLIIVLLTIFIGIWKKTSSKQHF